MQKSQLCVQNLQNSRSSWQGPQQSRWKSNSGLFSAPSLSDSNLLLTAPLFLSPTPLGLNNISQGLHMQSSNILLNTVCYCSLNRQNLMQSITPHGKEEHIHLFASNIQKSTQNSTVCSYEGILGTLASVALHAFPYRPNVVHRRTANKCTQPVLLFKASVCLIQVNLWYLNANI